MDYGLGFIKDRLIILLWIIILKGDMGKRPKNCKKMNSSTFSFSLNECIQKLQQYMQDEAK